MKKTERGKNFLELERIHLIKICNRYKHIIECKRSDMTFLKDKEKAWHQIARQFNAVYVGGAARTVRQLQEKYKNIKKDLRKQHAENKKYICGTGGGPYIPPPDTKTEEEKELFETIKLSADGVSNEFDTDGRYGITGVPPQTIMSIKPSQNVEKQTERNIGMTFANKEAPPSLPELDDSFYILENENILENTEQEQVQEQRKLIEKNNIMERTLGEREASTSFFDFNKNFDRDNPFITSKYVEQDQETQSQNKDSENNKAIENIAQQKSSYVGPTNRRRPILKKNKKKTVTSAGGQFELAAKKKIELIEQEMMVAKIKRKEIQEEHNLKIEILKARKENEILKNKILKEGKMVFEF